MRALIQSEFQGLKPGIISNLYAALKRRSSTSLQAPPFRAARSAALPHHCMDSMTHARIYSGRGKIRLGNVYEKSFCDSAGASAAFLSFVFFCFFYGARYSCGCERFVEYVSYQFS
jgi:hypothetical protein